MAQQLQSDNEADDILNSNTLAIAEKIANLFEDPSNRSCADCNDTICQEDAWAVLSKGIFVCSSCALAHIEIDGYRAVPPEKRPQDAVATEGFLLASDADRWEERDVACLEATGNHNSNEKHMAKFPPWQYQPPPDTMTCLKRDADVDNKTECGLCFVSFLRTIQWIKRKYCADACSGCSDSWDETVEVYVDRYRENKEVLRYKAVIGEEALELTRERLKVEISFESIETLTINGKRTGHSNGVFIAYRTGADDSAGIECAYIVLVDETLTLKWINSVRRAQYMLLTKESEKKDLPKILNFEIVKETVRMNKKGMAYMSLTEARLAYFKTKLEDRPCLQIPVTQILCFTAKEYLFILADFIEAYNWRKSDYNNWLAAIELVLTKDKFSILPGPAPVFERDSWFDTDLTTFDDEAKMPLPCFKLVPLETVAVKDGKSKDCYPALLPTGDMACNPKRQKGGRSASDIEPPLSRQARVNRLFYLALIATLSGQHFPTQSNERFPSVVGQFPPEQAQLSYADAVALISALRGSDFSPNCNELDHLSVAPIPSRQEQPSRADNLALVAALRGQISSPQCNGLSPSVNNPPSSREAQMTHDNHRAMIAACSQNTLPPNGDILPSVFEPPLSREVQQILANNPVLLASLHGQESPRQRNGLSPSVNNPPSSIEAQATLDSYRAMVAAFSQNTPLPNGDILPSVFEPPLSREVQQILANNPVLLASLHGQESPRQRNVLSPSVNNPPSSREAQETHDNYRAMIAAYSQNTPLPQGQLPRRVIRPPATTPRSSTNGVRNINIAGTSSPPESWSIENPLAAGLQTIGTFSTDGQRRNRSPNWGVTPTSGRRVVSDDSGGSWGWTSGSSNNANPPTGSFNSSRQAVGAHEQNQSPSANNAASSSARLHPDDAMYFSTDSGLVSNAEAPRFSGDQQPVWTEEETRSIALNHIWLVADARLQDILENEFVPAWNLDRVLDKDSANDATSCISELFSLLFHRRFSCALSFLRCVRDIFANSIYAVIRNLFIGSGELDTLEQIFYREGSKVPSRHLLDRISV